ncbi:hypothetical protein TNCV_1881231 [Trichonephila clavipes]|nr:hypothetical protein TNCV_1881231 [Trichonephila clavipes]
MSLDFKQEISSLVKTAAKLNAISTAKRSSSGRVVSDAGCGAWEKRDRNLTSGNIAQKLRTGQLHDGYYCLLWPDVCIKMVYKAVVLNAAYHYNSPTQLEWFQEHNDWTLHQWSHVLFSDESHFNLSAS